MSSKRQTFLHGFILGLIIPILGFFLIQAIFGGLTHFGLMEPVTSSTSGKRFRTLTLLAICLNVLPVHYYRRRSSERFLRGIITACFIFIILWIFYFSSSLM